MNSDIKARWVAALRSGEYRQARKRLSKGSNRRCCLGVLCDIAVADGVIEPAEEVGGKWTFEGLEGFPSSTVMDWSGLDYGLAEALAEANDNGKRFSTIAKRIEADA